MQLSETNGGALLEIRELKTHFFLDQGVVKAVDGVSLSLRPGKTLGIVGESGCGKSITARSILQIVDDPGRIVAGEILYRRAMPRGSGPSAPNGHGASPPRPLSRSAGEGESRPFPPGGAAGEGESRSFPPGEGRAGEDVVDLARLHPRSREIRSIRGKEISMIFQEPMTSLSPLYTVGDQIGENILLHTDQTKREARARAIELLRQVGISNPEQRVDEYPHQLSGGMRQRAMIAMAIACNPSLLIADEPTTALDVTTQAQILELLKQMQQQLGMAIIVITHDLGVIAEMADDVAVMYLGQVVETADVGSIFHDPKHPYTQALLRSIPKVGGKVRQRLESIRGIVPDPFNRPRGCLFHPRCNAFRPGACDQLEPQSTALGQGRQVRCVLY